MDSTTDDMVLLVVAELRVDAGAVVKETRADTEGDMLIATEEEVICVGAGAITSLGAFSEEGTTLAYVLGADCLTLLATDPPVMG